MEKALYIVQVISAGVAQTPKLFIDMEKADAAYVEYTKECWPRFYSLYCEKHGISADCITSAQTFVNELDSSEKNKINYWVTAPENFGLRITNLLLPDTGMCKGRHEHIRHLAQQAKQASLAVKESFSRLFDKIEELSDNCDSMNTQVANGQPLVVADGETGGAAVTGRQEKPEQNSPVNKTQEWTAFVGSIRSMCGGSRNEYHLFTRQDWRHDVYSNATSFEYWEWVATKIAYYRERAIKAKYSVIDDPDSPGHYKFKTPGGIVREISCYTEWEAWCHAGLNLEGL